MAFLGQKYNDIVSVIREFNIASNCPNSTSSNNTDTSHTFSFNAT